MEWYWFSTEFGQLCAGNQPHQRAEFVVATPWRVKHPICRSIRAEEIALIGVQPQDWVITPGIEQQIGLVARACFTQLEPLITQAKPPRMETRTSLKIDSGRSGQAQVVRGAQFTPSK